MSGLVNVSVNDTLECPKNAWSCLPLPTRTCPVPVKENVWSSVRPVSSSTVSLPEPENLSLSITVAALTAGEAATSTIGSRARTIARMPRGRVVLCI